MAIKNLSAAAKGKRHYKTKEVPCPEFGEGETILVRKMTAGDTSQFFESLRQFKLANKIKNVAGTDVMAIRLACCMVNEDGEYILDPMDGPKVFTPELGLSQDTVTALFSAMTELSPISNENTVDEKKS